MRAYTTPSLKISIIRKDRTLVTDLEFTHLIFTIKGGGKKINKRVESSEVVEGAFVVYLSQEETGMFSNLGPVKSQINFFNGSSRIATATKMICVDDNLIDEVIIDG